MSSTTHSPEDPIVEDARRRLRATIDSSSADGPGLYLQQVAEAGLLALDALPSCPEAQQLAEIVAQQVDDVYEPLQNITRVDAGLENELLEFIGAVSQIQEEISDRTAVEKLAAFGDNLEELSARIVWHILANDDPDLAVTTEEADGPSPHSKLISQTTNGNNSTMLNLLDSLNSPLDANTPNGNVGDPSSQSVADNMLIAPLLHLRELSGTTVAGAIPVDQLSNPSAMLADSTRNIVCHSQTLDAEKTHQLGIDLLEVFRREGDLWNLSNSISLFRESLLLCPSGSSLRFKATGNLAAALVTQYGQTGNHSDLMEAITQLYELLKLCPPGHTHRTAILNNLASALMARYERGGSLLDLSDATKLAPAPMLDAYTAALDQLDILLATRDTLESKHTQLISSAELTQCKRLGLEAASYAVRQGHMTLAVELLERGRNLLFAQVGRYRVDLEELQEVDAELADRFFSLSSLLDASVVSNQPTLEGQTAFEGPIERYRRVSSAWNQTVDDIRAIPGFEHFLRSPAFLTLRAAADEGPVIIVIPGDIQSDALVVIKDRDTPHHVNLPKAGMGELVDLAISLVGAVHPKKDRAYDIVGMEKPVKKILLSLWNLVVRPIVDALDSDLGIPPHSRIWWCPTGISSLLPLHAAGHYGSEDTNRNLPAKYVSSYAPTLQALMRARRRRDARKAEKMLIVAQPGTPGQSPLPNAQPEAELVMKLVGEKVETTLFSGQEATHAAVLGRMVDCSWLHLTCHGMQNFASPLHSCFGLYDKPLTLQDIMQRGLPDATFAFLAACHTATGDIKLLDEGLHLAAGLQFAGFKGVVGTFWEVADIDGPVIAEAFYKALRDSQPEAEGMDCSNAAYALSEALKHLRDSGVPIHRWMRFIHMGI